MDQVVVCMTALPDRAQAQALAELLVGESLAACVNVVDGVTSVYFWEGQLQRDAEVLCFIKTTQARFSALRARILERHPYQLPELVALPVADGHAPYLEWVRALGRT